jgi:hypothetical protein
MSTLRMRIVPYVIEYLGEFEFIFETVLEYESEDQMGTFDAKKPPSKISCLGNLRDILPCSCPLRGEISDTDISCPEQFPLGEKHQDAEILPVAFP